MSKMIKCLCADFVLVNIKHRKTVEKPLKRLVKSCKPYKLEFDQCFRKLFLKVKVALDVLTFLNLVVRKPAFCI